MTITAYKMNCINYKPGEEKCRYLCGKIAEDPEPECYNPMIKDVPEWNRVDAAVRKLAAALRGPDEKGGDSQ